jgi:zinc D-Ala-D-Ala carboxypeptidase
MLPSPVLPRLRPAFRPILLAGALLGALLPGAAEPVTVTAAPPEPAARGADLDLDPAIPVTYVVRPGETMKSIARQYDLPVDHIRAWNAERYPGLLRWPHHVGVGWVLRLEGPEEPSHPAIRTVYRPDPCTPRDILTPYQHPDDHDRTVLDWTYRLPASYVPPDLTPVSRAGFTGFGSDTRVRADVIPDLRALREAALAEGHVLQIRSAYRSFATQQATYRHWVSVAGEARAMQRSARPGHSEHQLGTAIDVTANQRAPWEYRDWGETPAGAWMVANSWRFGFVMSYPPEKRHLTCYQYEPWHYRWIGRDLAVSWKASRLTLREFLAARG